MELQYLIFEKLNKVENEKKELNKCKYTSNIQYFMRYQIRE